MVWRMYILSFIINAAGFEVSAPSKHLVALRGQTTVLGCMFSSNTDTNLSNLVVTWQRQEDNQVVHSFYYGLDQLDRQSVAYRNRTALFVSELQRGNASLRIEGVGTDDAGFYLCLVSNLKGTGRARVQVEYGAFYTEPRLSISVNSHGVLVQYESEGFPRPEVQWVGEEGQALHHHTDLTEDSDKAVGLYHLKSSYEAPASSPLAVTFTLKNPLLKQDLQRPVSLRYAEDEAKSCECTATIRLSIVCAIVVFVFVFVLVFALVFVLRKRIIKTRHKSTGNTMNVRSVPLTSIDR